MSLVNIGIFGPMISYVKRKGFGRVLGGIHLAPHSLLFSLPQARDGKVCVCVCVCVSLAEEWLCPVVCAQCDEEVGAFDERHVYHFYNVLASTG